MIRPTALLLVGVFAAPLPGIAQAFHTPPPIVVPVLRGSVSSSSLALRCDATVGDRIGTAVGGAIIGAGVAVMMVAISRPDGATPTAKRNGLILLGAGTAIGAALGWLRPHHFGPGCLTTR